MIIKTCPICGNEFIPNAPRTKMCSPECQKISQKRNHAIWVLNNPEKEKENNRQKRKRTKYIKPIEEPELIKPSKLDAKIKEAAEQGMTYAERQRQETLRMAGKIQL